MNHLITLKAHDETGEVNNDDDPIETHVGRLL